MQGSDGLTKCTEPYETEILWCEQTREAPAVNNIARLFGKVVRVAVNRGGILTWWRSLIAIRCATKKSGGAMRR